MADRWMQRLWRAARLCVITGGLGGGLGLSQGCTAPYYANAARDFGASLNSNSNDLSAMLRGLGQLCRRHGDLAYLRARIEDPTDRKLVPFHDRKTALYSGRLQSIEARCAEQDRRVAPYEQMYAVLLSYGSSLRALGETQSTDFRDSFQSMGDSLGRLAITVRPDEPELYRMLQDGAQSVNQLARMALSARTERDIRKAVLAAKEPVRNILGRLAKADAVYGAQVRMYNETAQALLAKLERQTAAHGGVRPIDHRGAPRYAIDLLGFYDLALRTEDDLRRLDASVKLYTAALQSTQRAHDALVAAAEKKITVKMAFESIQKSTRDLRVYMQDLADQLDSLRLRGKL